LRPHWLFGRPFDSFPNLRVCLSENGIGWMPAVLEVAEWFMEAGRRGQPVPGQKTKLPAVDSSGREVKGFLGAGNASDMARMTNARSEGFDLRTRFREHIFGCFIKDDHGVRALDELGFDNIMMESDFPHMSSSYPNTPEAAARALAPLDDGQRRKLLTDNAARLFSWKKELDAIRAQMARPSVAR
jgi:predicted TIM-barrel fold metal-dependent hydrolase